MSSPTAGADMLSWHDVGGPYRGRQAGRILRVYRASCGKVIAVDNVVAMEDVQKVNATKFHRSVVRHVARQLMHHTGVSRLVATISVMGDFSTLSVDMNLATWIRPENENTFSIDMSDLPQVGDTV